MDGLISPWIYLLLFALAIWAVIGSLLKKKLSPAWKVGLFLAFFDFAFETCGALLGLWTSHGSAFPLGFVPAEVFIICLAAGTTYSWIIPKKLSDRQLYAVLFLISMLGTLIEAGLVMTGYLTYDNWNSFLAVPAYFVSFWLVHQAHLKLAK